MMSTDAVKYLQIATHQGTVPHTIQRAARLCRERQAAPHPSSQPIDLLGVVVHVETHNTNLVRLWITDTSLLPNPDSRASITLFGKKNRDIIVDKLIVRSGDVIRFNSVDLLHGPKLSRTHNNDLEFGCSRHTPEAGEVFARLCNVDDAAENDTIDFESMNARLPSTMHTHPDVVNELLASWRNCDSNKTSALPSLQSLPSWNRTLAEFHECTGVMGHVVAYVLQVVQQQPSDSKSKHKRRRSIKPATTPLQIPVIATLSDDNGATLVSFYLDHSRPEHLRFQSVLEQAHCERIPVRIMRVISRPTHGLSNCLRCPDEVLLLPTIYSDVILATDSDVYNHYGTGRNAWSQTQSSIVIQGASTPSDETFHTYTMSSLLDICIKGVSLREKLGLDGKISPPRLQRLLQSNDDTSCYSSAEIQIHVVESNEYVTVQADGEIVKVLCGGIGLSDWWPTPARIPGRLVVDMLRGLLLDRIVLRWKLSHLVSPTGSDCYKVISVSLPEL